MFVVVLFGNFLLFDSVMDSSEAVVAYRRSDLVVAFLLSVLVFSVMSVVLFLLVAVALDPIDHLRLLLIATSMLWAGLGLTAIRSRHWT